MRRAKSSHIAPCGFESEGMNCASCCRQYSRKESSVKDVRAKPTSAKSAGSVPRRCIEYTAGKSMRLKRSPLAPKKTTLHGLVMRSAARPARSGLLAAPSPLGGAGVAIASSGMRFALDGVAAELVTQCRDDFRAERFVLARRHPSHQ